MQAMALLKGNSNHRLDALLGVAYTTNDISRHYPVEIINTFPTWTWLIRMDLVVRYTFKLHSLNTMMS